MIQLRGFSKNFDNKTIFDSVDYEFKDFNFYGLVGESGCGKTTLLRLISLLDNQFDGELIVSGKRIKGLKKKERENLRVDTFSYVFSNAQLFDYLTVKENIYLPCTLQKKTIDEGRLVSLSEQRKAFDLLDRKDVKSLSEGEKQRVSILRALLLNNPVLICDEPTAHLNEELSKEITSLLLGVCKKDKKMRIRSTHDENLISYFDKTLHVLNGKLIENE